MDSQSQTNLFDLASDPLHSETNELHGKAPSLIPMTHTQVQFSPNWPGSEPTQNNHSIVMHSGPKAASHPILVRLVSHIFNESFGYRPDGKPYRLGPKSVMERLNSTDYVFVAGDEMGGVGYLFGKEIPSFLGRIAWIESMAVLPLYRRQGIARELVRKFFLATKKAFFLGCATPNPIAAYIICNIVPGKVYVSPCPVPCDLFKMLKEIQQHCFDLRGCSIDQNHFRIRTGFSPLSRSDQRDWNPREPRKKPEWWSEIENLPNEFEALLVIKR